MIDHIVKVFGLALVRAEERSIVGETEVRHRRLSEVTKLMVRESTSLEVGKCIYTRLPYPTRSGGLERAFIEWAQADGSVEAFCKISENRHDFARLRYVKDDGLPRSTSRISWCAPPTPSIWSRPRRSSSSTIPTCSAS